jgi:type I restriction enzyme S subunit
MGADGVKVLRPKVEADVKYLYHYLRQLRLTEGGYDRHFKYLKRSSVALPPLPEQRRIAEILDKADALRAKRRAALAQLDTLTQSIFLDMFGDPATNPKDVRQVALGDIAEIATGSTPSREVDGYFGGDIPWVKTTEVRGEVISDTEESLTEAGLRAIRGRLHPINSVVLAMYGQGKTRGQSGLLAVEAAVNQACAVVRPSASFDARFMFAQLDASYGRLRALGRGGNQENLNLELVKSFRVLLPPLTHQAEFVERVGAVGRVAALAKSSFSELDDLFASLQHRAFRGEL